MMKCTLDDITPRCLRTLLFSLSCIPRSINSVRMFLWSKSTCFHPVFIDGANFPRSERFWEEKKIEKCKWRVGRNIYASVAETLMQPLRWRANSCLRGAAEPYVRRIAGEQTYRKLCVFPPKLYALADRHCMRGRSLKIRVSYLREKNRNVLSAPGRQLEADDVHLCNRAEFCKLLEWCTQDFAK